MRVHAVVAGRESHGAFINLRVYGAEVSCLNEIRCFSWSWRL